MKLKKMICVCLVTVFLTRLTVFATDERNSNLFYDYDSEKTTQNYEEESLSEFEIKQKPANDAHRELFIHFSYNEEGMIYPEEFCGDYIKDNILHICLTTNNKEVVDKYWKMTDYSDAVCFETAKYSLTSMINLQNDISDFLISKEIKIYCSYIDQITNRLILEVDKNDINNTLEYIHDNFDKMNKYNEGMMECIDVIEGNRNETSSSPMYGGSTL